MWWELFSLRLVIDQNISAPVHDFMLIMLCSLDPCLFVYFHILSSEIRKVRNHSSTVDGAVSLEPSSD